MSGETSEYTAPTPVDLDFVGPGFLSVQALNSLPAETMGMTMDRYFAWLRKAFRGTVQVRGDANSDDVTMSLAGVPAIRLRRREGGNDDRVSYDVVGGALAKKGGVFEFVRGPDGKSHAILEGFRPRLPGWLYTRTHGAVHVGVMNRFAADLEREALASASASVAGALPAADESAEAAS